MLPSVKARTGSISQENDAMYINGQYLLLISLILFLIDAGLVIYHLIYRRLAIIPMRKVSLISAIMVTTLLVFGAIHIVNKQSDMLAHERAPFSIFTCSVYVTIILFWLIFLLKSADNTTRQLLESLMWISEANAPNLNGNAVYVHHLTEMIYNSLPIEYRLKVNPDELLYAALLIDIGQLGIPRELREKWGKLTPKERELMKKSPDIADKIIRSSGSFKRIAGWIRMSGERIDGTGRLGVSGRDIPLESRILAVACTFAALTLSRTYKASRSIPEAMEELRIVSGTQLDEMIVESFIQVPTEQIEECLEDVTRQNEDIRKLGSNI